MMACTSKEGKPSSLLCSHQCSKPQQSTDTGDYARCWHYLIFAKLYIYFFHLVHFHSLSLTHSRFSLTIPEQKLVLNTLTVNIFIIMFSICFRRDIHLNLVYFISWRGEGWCSIRELWIIGFWAWCIVEQIWGLGVSDSERTSIHMLGAVLVVVLPPSDHMTQTSTHREAPKSTRTSGGYLYFNASSLKRDWDDKKIKQITHNLTKMFFLLLF